MRRRRKYDDVRSVGRSRLVPFDPNESPGARHERRKETNLAHRQEFDQWCKDNGWTLEIKNDGHHWILKRVKDKIQWWPSSAKVVINEQWGNGIHCHDYEQLEKILMKRSRP